MNVSTYQDTNMRLYLCLSFVILWVLDTLFTLMFVHQHGLQMEANPVMREVLRMGPGYFVVVKAALAFLVSCVHPYIHTGVYIFLNLVMLPVVILGGIVSSTI